MKCFRLRMISFAVVLIALSALVFLDPNRAYPRAGSNVSAVRPATSSPFIAAAKRNASLRYDLNWAFGGKPQRGWYLYIRLINRLLDTDRDAGSEGFARHVARWQEKQGLAASGVLDEETLFKMIAEWQGKRLKDRTPAQPDQLLTAPISDFYDPTREEALRLVERQTYAAYKQMVRAALKEKSLGLAHGADKGELAATEKYLKIISSFRSREYQEKLRRESPGSGGAGLAVNSPHFTGRALDIYVGGDPVDTKDSNRAVQVQTPVYRWLVRNAERFGFVPYCYEPWHWEYVGR
ncbi:MAG: zinc D-Ala-D-Ala carboxypeptidase [Blastocatellia bacterium]|nr:zinc D-Ala-D-Ala carboxypeptidase [Blastocatellia bacterium]